MHFVSETDAQLPDARQALVEWLTRFFSLFRCKLFRVGKPFSKMSVESITHGGILRARLWTQYQEIRTEMQDCPVSSAQAMRWYEKPEPVIPSNYTKETQSFPIRSSRKDDTCPDCNGQGKVTCSTCNGSGETTCSSCNGWGHVDKSESVTVTDSDGQSHTEWKTVQESCPWCFNGKVRCKTCGGSRVVTCNRCNGDTRVASFSTIIYEYRWVETVQLVSTKDANTQKVVATFGATEVSAHFNNANFIRLDLSRITQDAAYAPGISNDEFTSLVQDGTRAHETLANSARKQPGTILFDKHETTLFPVSNLEFSCDDIHHQTRYKFTVIGTRQRNSVIPPEIPFSKLKIVAFAVLHALAVLLPLSTFFLTRNSIFTLYAGIGGIATIIAYLLIIARLKMIFTCVN